MRQIPNIITGMRFLLLIPILVTLMSHDYRLGFYVFIFAGLSDGLDGFLARRFHWTSRLGAIADPLADKLLMVVTFFALTYTQDIPFWLFILVMARDLIIISGALAYHYLIAAPEYRPSYLSKVNTVLQIGLVLVLLFDRAFYALPEALLQAGIVLMAGTTLLSLGDYMWTWGRKAYLMRRTIA